MSSQCIDHGFRCEFSFHGGLMIFPMLTAMQHGGSAIWIQIGRKIHHSSSLTPEVYCEGACVPGGAGRDGRGSTCHRARPAGGRCHSGVVMALIRAVRFLAVFGGMGLYSPIRFRFGYGRNAVGCCGLLHLCCGKCWVLRCFRWNAEESRLGADSTESSKEA